MSIPSLRPCMCDSCHEPNSKGSGSAWKPYMNARVVGLFMLVLLEYPNGKGVVRATSRGLDTAPHCSSISSDLMEDRRSNGILNPNGRE
ncbi:hypothetical protein Tco_1127367 [Tanacetum coccineum]